MKRLFLATGNKDKIREVKAILPAGKFILETCLERPDMPEVHEDGATLLENSVKKAISAASYFKMTAIADDTGLEVEALNGSPGVYSARWAGENCTYMDNNLKLLRELKGIPWTKRKARFVSVITIASPHGEIKSFEGIVDGYITEKMLGDKGFGYDPLFFVPEFGFTYAQMPASMKNRISHRSKALKALSEYLRFTEKV